VAPRSQWMLKSLKETCSPNVIATKKITAT
jgi:hypothetical protein